MSEVYIEECGWKIICVLVLKVWCTSLLMSLCMFIVSNAWLMSSATVIVHFGGCFWLKPVAVVLLMLSSAVSVEFLLLT